MIAVFCACTEYLGRQIPQRVLWIITFNLVKTCMESWLTYKQWGYYGLSNKYTIVLQGTFSENSSVSSLKLERIPSGWIYMRLFTIGQQSLLPQLSKHFLQNLLHLFWYCRRPDECNLRVLFVFCLLCPPFILTTTAWASQTFLVEILLKKYIGKKPPKLKSKKHSCKVFVFKITPGQKA